MDKSENYIKKLACLQRQVHGEIARLMRKSGREEIHLSPEKSNDRMWVVFYEEYLSEYRTGYLNTVKYHAGKLSFEIIWGDGGMIEISEESAPLFMDMPEIMVKIYKNLLNEINK